MIFQIKPVFRAPLRIATSIFLLILMVGCAATKRVSEQPEQDNMVIQMIEEYYAQRDAENRIPNKSLDLAKEIPESASLAELEEKLKEILSEISRAPRQDIHIVYETIILLRIQPNIVRALSSIYYSKPEEAFQDRLLTLKVMGELQREDALDVFKNIVWKPLPPVTPGPADRISPREYEEMIHSKAVQGMAYIRAEDGEIIVDADKEVLRVIKEHPSHSVRITAIDAFMWNHGDTTEAASVLYEILPQEYYKYVERPRFYRGVNQQVFSTHLKSWQKKWSGNR